MGIVSGAGAGGGTGSDRRGGASEGEISRRTSRGASSYVGEGTGSGIDGEANRVPGSSLGRGASEGENSQGGRGTSRGASSHEGEATGSERRGGASRVPGSGLGGGSSRVTESGLGGGSSRVTGSGLGGGSSRVTGSGLGRGANRPRSTRNPDPDNTGRAGVQPYHIRDGFGTALCRRCMGRGCAPEFQGDTRCSIIFTKKGTKRKY